MFVVFNNNRFVALEHTYWEARQKQCGLTSFNLAPLESCIVEVDRLVDFKHALNYEGSKK